MKVNATLYRANLASETHKRLRGVGPRRPEVTKNDEFLDAEKLAVKDAAFHPIGSVL